MDTVARNALRVALAGAGIVVLGASYVGQASADEAPVPASDEAGTATAPDTADSPLAVPTVPAPQYLLAPDSLDTFVLPTVADVVAPDL